MCKATPLFAACVLGAQLLGCGTAARDEGTTRQVSLPVINGAPSAASHDDVIFLRANYDDGSFHDCTGTLISSRVVVTARHCVSRVQEGEFVCLGDGELQDDGSGAGTFGEMVRPMNIEVYVGAIPEPMPRAHGAQTFATQTPNACRDDIALLLIDTPIEDVEYPALRLTLPTRVGERVTLVGYGLDDSVAAIERREVSSVRILDVGAPGNEAQDPNATTPARSFVVAGNTVCFGDSGAPALAAEGEAVLGVYSRITGGCLASESRNTFMQLAGFRELVEQALAEAGENAVIEGEASSEGGAPDAGCGASDCATIGTGGGGGEPASDSGVGDSAAGAGATASGEAGATNAAGQGGAADVPEAEPVAPHGHDAFSCSVSLRAAPQRRSAAWIGLVALVLSGRAFERRRPRRRRG